jgi:hypothetical protein
MSVKHSCERILSEPTFLLNQAPLTKVDSIIHLGLPIGNKQFVENFWNEKSKKIGKSLYSLNGIGLRAYGMDPLTLSKIYSIYCQPVFNYGLELLFISKSKLKQYDSAQATLIKNNIGLSKYHRSTPLLAALNIDKISKLYAKFKFLFIEQLKSVSITANIFNYLKRFYQNHACSQMSYFSQLKSMNEFFGVDLESFKKKEEFIEVLNAKFQPMESDNELVRKTYNFCKLISCDSTNKGYYTNILRNVLRNSGGAIART